MKKKGFCKFVFLLILSIFLLSEISSVAVGTCDVVARTSCTGTTDKIVMGLSSTTNSHGEFPDKGTYSTVLCCGFGTGQKTCTGKNNIINLSSATNAHGEIPSGKSYANPVCYENLECISSTSNCGTVGTNVETYSLSMLSLSSTTNAHIGKIGDYATKICCKGLLLQKCEITSTDWGTTQAITGTIADMIVQGNGAQCAGQPVSFVVKKDNLLIDSNADDQPATVFFEGSKATGKWVTTNAVIGGEYYFNANISNKAAVKSTSNLKILDPGICDAISSCNAYTTQSNCENDLTICNVAEGDGESIFGVGTCSQTGQSCVCAWDNSRAEGQKCAVAIDYTPISSKVCGDGIVDVPNSVGTNEQCDPDTTESAFLTAASTCSDISTNLKMDSYTSGTLNCLSDCSFDVSECVSSSLPICGDGVVNRLEEDCDGTDLKGKDCTTLGFSGGSLSCKSDCTFDKTYCNPQVTDSDGDGLSDTEEAAIGTNPTDPDTDNDGFSDGEETDAGTDPLDPNDNPGTMTDTDGDGLSDTEEAAIGTNPTDPDTDNDGFSDGEEVTAGTDPLDPASHPEPTATDSDGDGLSDAEETTTGADGYITNPTDPDTDNDGFSDGEEADAGTDPTNPNSNPDTMIDTDGDGLSDTEEAAIGTNPTDPDTDNDGFSDGEEVAAGTDPLDSSDHPNGTTTLDSKYCGDGIINLNDANFNEQCDPSDGPGKSGAIKFITGKDKCTSYDSFTGGTLKCGSDCALSYTSCTGGTSPTCGDGIVNQIKESCDKTDLQGLTCKYLGYNEGTLSCKSTCKADTSTCIAIQTTESGTCTITQTVDKDCNTEPIGYKTITWKGTWDGETQTGTAHDKCVAGGTVTVPCPAQIQLPFFDYLEMASSLIFIALVYISLIFKKRKK